MARARLISPATLVGREVEVAHCGGNPDGGLGTDVARIKAAIEQVHGPAGVALPVDLGGAESSSEMAIELLPADWQEPIVICNAPIVEGAVLAATEAAGGSPLAELRATARELAPSRVARGGAGMDSADPIAPDVERASGGAVVRDPTGLHARPAVKLTKLAKQFEATVRVRAGSGGDWVNAKSPNRVLKLKARPGEAVSFEAEGADAADAVSALVGLVERNFDD